ncbi:MAG: phosphate acyltransferase, partial [Lachnospiraceae bacterium]|nr:phosphate acyltransferase [Lachnospiraceae bacterium]
LSKVKQGMKSTVMSSLGGLMAKKALKKTLKGFSTDEYGGAPMLGLNGLVVKTHGSSKSIEVKNSILQCIRFSEQDINGKIRRMVEEEDSHGI